MHTARRRRFKVIQGRKTLGPPASLSRQSNRRSVADQIRKQLRAITPMLILAAVACYILFTGEVSWKGVEPVVAEAENGQTIMGIASVIDGDTIEIHGERIRLLDIDAPETRQLCQDASGADYRCGQRAALAMSNFIGQRPVTCEWAERDRYGRILGRCIVGSEDAGLWLVKQGWAVPYRACKCESYRNAARVAESQYLGIWIGRFQLPWEWRQAH